MRRLFADASYFVALASPKDSLHHSVVDLTDALGEVTIVTTEDVLIELLNFFSESGEYMRRKVAQLTRAILLNPGITVLARNEIDFLDALELYEARLDKGYSLTDCISMNVCREMAINEVLTSDRHFVQEGFQRLM